MNKLLLSLISWTILFLCSCGDDVLVKSDDTDKLYQYIYVVPERFTGNITNFYSPIGKDLYVNQGQTVRFCSGYAITQEISTEDSMGKYYESILWNINDNEYTLSRFRYTFQDAGTFKGTLKTTDLFGDTLSTEFNIYVNTPNSLALDFPYDGFNQADPNNENGLPLKWTVLGIDPWEEANCRIYLSNSVDSIWDKYLGTVPCTNEVQIGGPLVYDSTGFNSKDSSLTLYWAVEMTVESKDGTFRTYPSDVLHFSTRTTDSDSSVLKIPLVLKNYRDTVPLNTVITILDVNGDTLKVLNNTQKDSVLSTKLKPQTGIQVIVEEKEKNEYQTVTKTIDLFPNSVTWLDTVYLEDRTPPQILPVRRRIAFDDAIEFYIYDNGSGLNVSNMQVISGLDTLLITYNSPRISFYSHCGYTCNVEIIGEDNAHNPLPPFFWTIRKNVGYVSILGPFPKEGL